MNRASFWVGPLLPLLAGGIAAAQTAGVAAPPSPVAITLADAIGRAEANEPNLAALRAEQKVASLDRGNARAALLPSAIYHNTFLFTESNHTRNTLGSAVYTQAPVFIANNAVHEYTSQAVVTETLGLAQLRNVRAADAAAARATAELEVGRRGLVAATEGLFYGVLASERRVALLETAQTEAADFVALTEKREAAREAAHADVVKADLTQQQRARDLADARLAADRARLELAVLLFPDPLTPYTLQPPLASPPLPPLADVEAAARVRNPELASALSGLALSNAEVSIAKAAYLPDLGLNFIYGIDAAQLARYGPLDTSAVVSPTIPGTPGGHARNLGYSAAATLDIPVWDWLTTQRRIRQTEARRDAVRVALSATEKRLVVNLQESYSEAQTAQNQLASLDTTVRTAAESLRLTRMRYESGEATVLEVVDAQTTLYGAQVAQEDGEVRYQQALSSLETLTGVL